MREGADKVWEGGGPRSQKQGVGGILEAEGLPWVSFSYGI